MFVRVMVESSEPLSEFKKQGEVFAQLQSIMENLNTSSIDGIENLVNALRVVENIKSVEIINPTNYNGFIFEF
jgi:hypothetical protein